MVDINWNILRPVDIGGAFQQGMEQGRQRRAEAEIDKQLAAMAQNPNAPISNELMRFAPRAAYDLQQQRTAQQKAAQKQAQEERRLNMTDLAKLFNSVTDEASYQRGLAIARNWNLDVSQAPANYDPNWVAEQRMLTEAFIREPQKLTNMAQELVDAGYDPGTPEFVAQMRQRIALGDSKVVTTTDGGMAGLYGPNGYQPLVVPNPGGVAPGTPAGAVAAPTSKEAYDALPPGSQYTAPDGTIRIKGGGGVGNGAGNFPPRL